MKSNTGEKIIHSDKNLKRKISFEILLVFLTVFLFSLFTPFNQSSA